jgi:hypothetical protein
MFYQIIIGDKYLYVTYDEFHMIKNTSNKHLVHYHANLKTEDHETNKREAYKLFINNSISYSYLKKIFKIFRGYKIDYEKYSKSKLHNIIKVAKLFDISKEKFPYDTLQSYIDNDGKQS